MPHHLALELYFTTKYHLSLRLQLLTIQEQSHYAKENYAHAWREAPDITTGPRIVETILLTFR